MQTDEPGRRDRKRLKTLDLLATVAMRLFEQKGFAAVTMEQIATESDVAKGTLYNHFSTKEALLTHGIQALLDRDLVPLRERLGPDAGFPNGVPTLMDALAHWCEAHRDYLAPYLRYRFMELQNPMPASAAKGQSDIVDVYAFLIGNSQRAGEFRTDLEPRHLAVLFHHLCLGVLLRWLLAKNLKLRRELGTAVDLFVHGAVPLPPAVHKRARKA